MKVLLCVTKHFTGSTLLYEANGLGCGFGYEGMSCVRLKVEDKFCDQGLCACTFVKF